MRPAKDSRPGQDARLARIGIEPGKSFDFAGTDPTVKKSLEKAANDALKLMQEKATIAPVTNGWQIATDTIGVYGNSYLNRAVIAMIGLGANPPEDAVYLHDCSDCFRPER